MATVRSDRPDPYSGRPSVGRDRRPESGAGGGDPSPLQRFNSFIDKLLGDRNPAPGWVPDWAQGPLSPLWDEPEPGFGNTYRPGGTGLVVPDPEPRWKKFAEDPPEDESGYDPTWSPRGEGAPKRPAPARKPTGPTQVDDDQLGWLAQYLAATRRMA